LEFIFGIYFWNLSLEFIFGIYFWNLALKSFLHFLHFLKEPSFIKDTESFEEQKIHIGEKFVCKPLLLMYSLNDSK
jgi:hypothetical protein